MYANIFCDAGQVPILRYFKPGNINPESATYNLQQTTISNFAAFSKITNKA